RPVLCNSGVPAWCFGTNATISSMLRSLPVALCVTTLAVAQKPFNVVEASIAQMRTAMEQHRVTSRELVTQYLTRIAFYEDKLHAAITVNRNAVREAEERDRDRAEGRIRGPLHGIPIA